VNKTTEKKETVQLEINVAFDNDAMPQTSAVACETLHVIAVQTGDVENTIKGALAFCVGALRALETHSTSISIFKNNATLKKGEVIAEKLE
jgi:hypothetical protein